MNWFVARIVFRIISGNGDHTPQFDEQLKLISAASEAAAFEKASLIGKKEQDSFLNSSNQKVEWKFIGLAELEKINELTDGAELCSRITEADHPFHYEYFIQQKNDDIAARFITLKTRTN